MTPQQLETLQMMASTRIEWAYMYGGPHSYHCYRNLLHLGYVEEVADRKDWVQLTEKGRDALAQEEAE